ncbi:MAG: HAD family hydrolase, partial [Chloroflexi bacterium]|nr:HAD family hydrolase [Chloroflexota bacterium]
MIKAVLLDLDDTLIRTDTVAFTQRYLEKLGHSLREELAAPPDVIPRLVALYKDIQATDNPGETLYERTVSGLAAITDSAPMSVEAAFARFYADVYPALCESIQVEPAAVPLLERLFAAGYQVVIATNPALPIEAIQQRMAAGCIPAYPFALITSMQTMHFGKPDPAYYEEIRGLLDQRAAEMVMVGDDYHNDIQSAAAAGLHTYHLGPGGLAQFLEQVRAGWLDTLADTTRPDSVLLNRLRVFPAVVDSLKRTATAEMIQRCPDVDEWSMRDVICHLRDYEVAQNQVHLKRVAAEDNPFIAADYDPWAGAFSYPDTPVDKAFAEFASPR